MKKLLLIIIAAISWSAEAGPLGLLPVQLDVEKYASRAAAASAALADLKRLYDVVQSPKPSENAWVASERTQIAEIKDLDAKVARFILLEKSAEYQQSKLHNHLQEINKALLCVMQNPESLQREMYCWSVASFLLDDELFDYGIKLLINSKRLPENLPIKIGTSTPEGIQLRYRLLSRGIQESIMFPYLQGKVTR